MYGDSIKREEIYLPVDSYSCSATENFHLLYTDELEENCFRARALL